MTRWGEIKCPKCAAPPIALWDALVRSLEESDAREARLEARIEELEAKISEMFDAAQQVHRDGGRELARLATEAYDHD